MKNSLAKNIMKIVKGRYGKSVWDIVSTHVDNVSDEFASIKKWQKKVLFLAVTSDRITVSDVLEKDNTVGLFEFVCFYKDSYSDLTTKRKIKIKDDSIILYYGLEKLLKKHKETGLTGNTLINKVIKDKVAPCEKTLEKVLSLYFKTSIKIDLGNNSPSISKQLKKQNITVTQKELQAIAELQYLSEYCGEVSHATVETALENINMTVWAMPNSCHSPNGVGSNSPYALASSQNFAMLQVWATDNKPFARAYFRTDNNEYGHAGLYANTKKRLKDNLGHTAYLATSLLICAFVDTEKRVDDFVKVDGLSEYNFPHDVAGVWLNMHENSGYQTYGTDETVLSDAFIDETKFTNLSGEPLEYEGDGVWLDDETLGYCEQCGCTYNLEYDGFYSSRYSLGFCSSDCALEWLE